MLRSVSQPQRPPPSSRLCGIAQAAFAAHQIVPGKPVEIEVESLEKLRQALEAGADIVMLDELSLEDMREAVKLTAGRAKLEVAGGKHPARDCRNRGERRFHRNNRGLSLVLLLITRNSTKQLSDAMNILQE